MNIIEKLITPTPNIQSLYLSIFLELIQQQMDKERQILITGFSGQIKQYHAQFVLSPSNQFLQISVESENKQTWRIVIDQEYIDRQEQFFKSIFGEPQDILDQLYHRFNQIVIEEKQLRFSYRYGGIRKKEKTFGFKLQADYQQTINYRKISMNERLLQINERMKCLEQSIQRLVINQRQEKATVKAIEETLRLMNQRIIKEQQKTKVVQNGINSISQMVSTLQLSHHIEQPNSLTCSNQNLIQQQQKDKFSDKNQNPIKQFYYNPLKIDVLESSILEIKNIQRQLNQSQVHLGLQLKKMDHIGHNLKSPFNNFYNITSVCGISAKIRRVNNGGWFNFVNKFQILPNQSAKYSIRINKHNLTNNAVMVGFCTQNAFGSQRSFQHLQSVYLDCFNRLCHEGGIKKTIQTDYQQVQGIIDCVADLEDARFTWSMSSERSISCSVPKRMKQKSIYLSIILLYTDDQVDLFI